MTPDQGLYLLTHPALDKMAAILSDDIFSRIFLNEKFRISIQSSIADKPLSEPMLTWITKAYVRRIISSHEVSRP